MTNRKLENWIEGYMLYMKEQEPPTLFIKWSAIATIAAALKRKCWLVWWEELTFYPNNYIVLVGPSGTGKNTAMAPARRMLEELNITMSAESITREQFIRAFKECRECAPDKPEYVHNSLTVFVEEFMVFVGKADPQFIYDLTDLYDCKDSWKYHTKGQGKDNLTRVWLNILGGTTPLLMQQTFPTVAFGSGLTARILFIHADKKSKIRSRPTPAPPGLRDDLITDLERISMLSGPFIMTEEFVDTYVGWRDDSMVNPPFEDPNMEGYNSRRAAHLLKISMIVSASRSDSMKITEHDFQLALGLLLEAEGKMGRTVKFAGQNRMWEVTQRMHLMLARKGELTHEVIFREFSRDADSTEIYSVMHSLEKMGKARFVIQGDKTKMVYTGKVGGENPADL